MQTIPGTSDNRSLRALLHPRLLTQVEMKLVAGGDSPDAGTKDAGPRKCENDHVCGGNRCQDVHGDCKE